LLAHEVGVETNPKTGRYHADDPASVLDDARAAATYGVSAGKAWEYNYMLGRDGSIFEQAGEYVGAHCLNFNPESVGVIWLNALGVPPTAAQLASWWWLRDHLVDIGLLTDMHMAAPHYRYRSTSCPGVLAEPPGIAWASPTGEGRLGNLIPALVNRPAPNPQPASHPNPQPPTTVEDDDMAFLLYRDKRFNNVFRVGDAAITIPEALLKADGGTVVEDVHDQTLIACMRSSKLTMAEMVPNGDIAMFPPFNPPDDLKHGPADPWLTNG
jgi:hypothetical protein